MGERAYNVERALRPGKGMMLCPFCESKPQLLCALQPKISLDVAKTIVGFLGVSLPCKRCGDKGQVPILYCCFCNGRGWFNRGWSRRDCGACNGGIAKPIVFKAEDLPAIEKTLETCKSNFLRRSAYNSWHDERSASGTHSMAYLRNKNGGTDWSSSYTNRCQNAVNRVEAMSLGSGFSYKITKHHMGYIVYVSGRPSRKGAMTNQIDFQFTSKSDVIAFNRYLDALYATLEYTTGIRGGTASYPSDLGR